MNIETYLAEKKKLVDQALATCFHDIPECPPLLKEAMEYSLKAGGKRIRPILVIASAEVFGKSAAQVMPAALAFELIHTFSLIHDDLPAMDNDDLRRGKPTNHKVFGEGVAILAGDGMLTHAFYLLARAQVSSDLMAEIAKATGAEGMVGGQVLDLQGENATLNADSLEKIHFYKTGRLITAAVTTGATLGGASASQLKNFRAYGEKIGLAFQIADDVLNVESSTEALGKKAGSDQNRHKSTYPGLWGLKTSKQKADQLVNEAVTSLESFGVAADPLRAIAQYIVHRSC